MAQASGHTSTPAGQWAYRHRPTSALAQQKGNTIVPHPPNPHLWPAGCAGARWRSSGAGWSRPLRSWRCRRARRAGPASRITSGPTRSFGEGCLGPWLGVCMRVLFVRSCGEVGPGLTTSSGHTRSSGKALYLYILVVFKSGSGEGQRAGGKVSSGLLIVLKAVLLGSFPACASC